MSPTWITPRTCGSALTESMNAGVAASWAASVGDVPYGESPYTASVNASLCPCSWAEASAVGRTARANVVSVAASSRVLMDRLLVGRTLPNVRGGLHEQTTLEPRQGERTANSRVVHTESTGLCLWLSTGVRP